MHTLIIKHRRVPTKDDFIALDKAMYGGTGANRSDNPFGKYCHATTGSGTSCSNGGGTWGGSRFTAFATNLTTTYSYYWSASEYSATNGHYLAFGSGHLYPQNYGCDNGFALRCVR